MMPAPQTDPTSNPIDEIARSVAEGNCVLFVGAGFSRAFTAGRFKSASELAKHLVDILRDELDDVDTASRVEEAVRSFGAEQQPNYNLRLAAQYFITELAASAPGEDSNQSERRERYRSARLRLLDALSAELSGHIDAATLDLVQPLLRLPWASIYTTNYDTLLEATLTASGLEYQVTTRPTDLASHRQGRLEVVKIHGSIDEIHLDDELPIVITADDYANFSTTRGLLLDELRVNLAQKDFLFLGYGLQDENLDLVIREVARSIEDSPRRLWVQHREAATAPMWRTLRQRGFQLYAEPDLLRFSRDLTRSLAEFRTSHDERYFDFTIKDRDQRDSPVDLVEFHKTGTEVASSLWHAAKSGVAPDTSRVHGDPVTALFQLLRAKQPEKTSAVAEGRGTIGRAVSAWLVGVDDEHIVGTMQGYHRALEALRHACVHFVAEDFVTVRRWLKLGAIRHQDALSRWLELQLLQHMIETADARLAGVARNFVFEMAARWKHDPDSNEGRLLRGLVPRLAAMIKDHPRCKELLQIDHRDPNDSMLVWELSKFSGKHFTEQSSTGPTQRLGDDVVVPVALVLDRFQLAEAGSKAVHPITRRASLRAWFDSAVSRGEDSDLRELLEFEEDFLPRADIDGPDPFFASFILLEQVAMAREERLITLLRHSHRILLRMLEFASADEVTATPGARARGRHLLISSIRSFVLTLPYVSTDTDRQSASVQESVEEHMKRLVSYADADPWLAENLLNLLAHRRRRPDLSVPPGRLDELLQGFLDTRRQSAWWDRSSPILRYYAWQATPKEDVS